MARDFSVYARRVVRSMEETAADCRLAVRAARRSVAFTALVVGTLAVAVGADTAVFSVVRDLVFRPLPFRAPNRLLAAWDTYLPMFAKVGVSPAEYAAWSGRRDLFETTAWYRYVPLDGALVNGSANAIAVHAGFVSPDLFPVLGLRPLIGRPLRHGEPPGSALLSYRLWRDALGADPNIIGRTLGFQGESITVAGVMPAEARFPAWADLWLPAGPGMGDELTNPVRHALGFVARLRPGVSVRQAAATLSAVSARLALAHPKTSTGWGVRAASLHDDLTGDLRPALLLLFGSASLLLLIACANVASLLLARAWSRAPEIAIRTAIGASLFRIARQLLTESLLLAGAGGALGWLIARGSLLLLLPAHAGLEVPVLAFLLAVTIAAGIVFGLAPALHVLRAAPNSLIHSSAAPGARRVRSALVAVEFAVTLVLVIAGALLARGYARLISVSPGFQPEGVVSVRLLAPPTSPPGVLFRRMESTLSALPGVTAVASSNAVPLLGDRANTSRFNVPGSELINPDALPAAQIRLTSPDYFNALGIPIVSGRAFTDSDLDQPVVIVNQTLARRYWPGRDPVGLRFITGPWGPNPSWSTIVGVAGDVKDFGLDSEPALDIYHPSLGGQFLLVKTNGNALALTGDIERTLHRLDPGLAIASLRAMPSVAAESAAPRRWTMTILVVFAVLALLLALGGIYGVMSWSVTQQRREVGIRIALGAQRGSIVLLVLGDSARLALAGLLLGLPASLAFRRILSGQVYGVSTGDPIVYISAAAGLTLAAVVACLAPARRAASVDPAVSLRQQ